MNEIDGQIFGGVQTTQKATRLNEVNACKTKTEDAMNQKFYFHCKGRLVFLDLFGCSFESINSQEYLLAEATKAAEMAQMKVLSANIVPFHPQGLSLILTLAESHLTIHTYPELGYAAIDIFTCGGGNPIKAALHLLKVLKPKAKSINSRRRGVLPQSKKIASHSLVTGDQPCLSEVRQF